MLEHEIQGGMPGDAAKQLLGHAVVQALGDVGGSEGMEALRFRFMAYAFGKTVPSRHPLGERQQKNMVGDAGLEPATSCV